MRKLVSLLLWCSAMLAVLAGAFYLAQTGDGGGTGIQPTTNKLESGASAISQGAKAFALVREADELFGLAKMWTFHFKIEPDAWAAMAPKNFRMAGPESQFQYARATLEFQGKTYAEVGVRFKGNSSFNASRGSLKRSLKLDFNRFRKNQKFLGLTKLNLNNNAMDPSQMREALAYEVFRRAGLPAPRTAFARVHLTLPGKFERQYVGLYTIVEEVDDHFLRANFGTKKGLLLKPEMMQGVPYLGEDWSVYAARYEPKSYVDAEDARRLIAFTELVDKADEGVFRQQIGSFIDVDQYLRFVAVQAALANLDSPLVTGHNYYLYLHPSTWRFMFMPWDLNEAFGGFFVAGRPEQQIDLSITHPFGGPNKLFERLTQVPELQTAYKQQFEELLAGPFSKEKLFADVEAVATMLRPALIEDKTIALEQFQQNLAEDTLTKAMSSDTRRRPPMGFRSGLPGAQRPDLKSGPIAAGPRGRPEGGGFPGMRMPKPPLKSFIAGRVASIQTQLEGKSPGYVPSARPFGPGGSGGPGGLGGPALGPVMVFSEAFMRVADADRDRELSSAEFSSAWKKLFEQCDTDKSGKLNVEKLRAGLAALLPPPPGFNGTLPDYDGLPPDEGMATSEAARPQQRPERTPGRVNEGPGFRPPRFGPQPGMRRDVPVVELARQIVRSADEDRDGALSSNELQKAAAEWFRDWDRDKSTALDLEELGEGWMKLLGPPPDFGPPQVHEASA